MYDTGSIKHIKEAQPLLFVVSGPSGVGKTSAVKAVVQAGLATPLVTYTTRPLRPLEVDGMDYHFVSREKFEQLISAGRVTEWVRKYPDYYYGSNPEWYRSSSADNLIIELDVHGFALTRYVETRRAVGIYIAATNSAMLSARRNLRDYRSSDTTRDADFQRQNNEAHDYDYCIPADSPHVAVELVLCIVRAELAKQQGARWLLEATTE